MFKKLKEKITEEVKSSPQRFQQLTQSVSDKLQGTSTSEDNFFSIGDDDTNISNTSTDQGFSSVNLVSPSVENRSRRMSNSSMASDISFLPRYEAGSLYHLQSDLDVSASELEDNVSQSSSQLGHLSKEQIYSAFQKSQMRYYKYRGRYTDLARHYKELERENAKMKSVLVETQDKAIRRVAELKEQCSLEQKAKAHLEGALRDELDEKQMKIKSLQTKINLLQGQNSSEALVNVVKADTNNHLDSEKFEQLTKYLNDARSEIEALNSKIQEYKANAIVFQSKEQENKTKISNLEKDLASFSEREKENNIKLAENKMELHNELLSKDSEISRLKKELENVKRLQNVQDKDAKSVKIENLQTQNKKLIDKLESLTQKCNGLENDLLKVEKYKIDIRELHEKNLELNMQVAEMQEQLKIYEINSKGNEETVKRLREDIDNQTKQYKAEIESMRENAKQGLFNLEKQISEKIHRDFQAKEEALKKEFALKLEEISSSNKSLKEMHLQLVEKDNEIRDILDELSKVKKLLEQKENQFRELENNHLELIDECSTLRSTVNNLKKQKVSSESIKINEEKIARLQATIKTLHAETNNLLKISHEKEKFNGELQQSILKLESQNTELLGKTRLSEEREESVEMDTIECNLLEMKVHALEEEKKYLLESFEMERQLFNKMLEENEELKIKEINIAELENRNSKLEEKVVRLKGYLKDKENKIVELNKLKLILEEEISKLSRSLRVSEERDEAIEMDKTECNLLQIKVQHLENEKRKLIESSEQERDIFNNSFHEANDEFNEQEIMNENISLAKENLDLKKVNDELFRKVRLFEEREQAVELETSECNLFKLKVHELEKEKNEILEGFEMERAMFNKILEEHKELKLKEEYIKDIQGSNRHLSEKVAKYKEYFKKKDDQIVDLQKIKLDLEQHVTKLQESLRIKEEEIEGYEVEKTECGLLQMKLRALEEENKNLLNSFEIDRATYEQALAKSSHTEDKVDELTQQNAHLRHEKELLVENLKKDKEDLMESFELERKNFTIVEGQVKELLRENMLLKEEKEEINVKRKQESDRSNEEIKNLKANVEQLGNDNESVRKELIEREAKIAELSQTMLKLNNELDHQTEMYKNLTDALEKEKIEHSTTVEKLKQMQQELDKNNGEISEIKTQLETVEKLYDEAKNRQTGDVRELEETKRKFYDMENEKIRLQKELKKKTEECNFKAKEMGVVEQQFTVLTQEKDGLMRELKQARETVDHLTVECERLGLFVNKAKEWEQVKKQNEVLQTECDKLNQEISELKVRINQLSSDNRHINDEQEMLIAEVEGYKAKNDFLETEKGEINRLRVKLEDERDGLQVSVNDLTEKLLHTTKELEVNSKSTTEEFDLAQIQQDFFEIKAKCDSLYVENKNLKAEYTKLEEQCGAFSKVKKDLESQIVELERHYNEALHEKQLLQDEVQELKIAPVNSSLDNLSIVKQEKALLGVEPNGPLVDRLQQEIDILREKLTQYKSLDITNKSSIEFYESELQKMTNKNEKLNRKLDEMLVTLNHCAELSSSTEIEYLRNVLYNYMLGKESVVLARVIAAVCKFDDNQTEAVLQKEQQKQTLLGQLGLL